MILMDDDNEICPKCDTEFLTCIRVDEQETLTVEDGEVVATQYFDGRFCVVSSQNGTGERLYYHTPGGER